MHQDQIKKTLSIHEVVYATVRNAEKPRSIIATCDYASFSATATNCYEHAQLDVVLSST